MGRILVVDDEKEIADLLEVYLQNDGYRHSLYGTRNFRDYSFLGKKDDLKAGIWVK